MKLRTKIVRKLRRIKRNIRLIWHPKERQLWAAYRLGHAAKTNEEKRKPRFMPTLCNTCKHSYEPKPKQPSFDTQGPTTDGKVSAERQGIRARATYHHLQEQAKGTLLHHHNDMERKKRETGKLDPDTHILPTVPPPRNLHFTRARLVPDNTWLL